jgi:hypothetical protein
MASLAEIEKILNSTGIMTEDEIITKLINSLVINVYYRDALENCILDADIENMSESDAHTFANQLLKGKWKEYIEESVKVNKSNPLYEHFQKLINSDHGILLNESMRVKVYDGDDFIKCSWEELVKLNEFSRDEEEYFKDQLMKHGSFTIGGGAAAASTVELIK